jgi:hypothetical protein
MNEKPFMQRLTEAYNKSNISDGEVLDLVYDRVKKILKEVDDYMTDPDTLFSTAEYNMMHGRMEACNEVMRILEDNEDYDYCEENPSPEDFEHPFVDEEKERRAGFFDE